MLNEGHEKHLDSQSLSRLPAEPLIGPEIRSFVSLRPDDINGLRKKAAIDCFQLRAIGHDRFMERIGAISENEISLIKKAIALILDMDPEHCVL